MANRVIHIRDRRPETAMEALNRITGLVWDSYPKSLLDQVSPHLRVDPTRRERTTAPAKAEALNSADTLKIRQCGD